ncbi:Sensor kinase CusS [Gemmata obscuriglobus]|uniref:histidine kinase n=1 Tax=Gemmata obscuriglobus TaxID=114 RepID=A0A2Z3H6T6_9BACT|nr:HAMP domain-containing sensor histidine kinase [Gemmata obscuriglobus]AWM39296.1 sensor histidine kinase [Gemmata obscuriglobus]QEG27642.1 Sensor kinase CusS [Gemmata obscuriglobus]VTS04807.1 histidine kinase : Histidine kinase OS=Singulisphaera acidiphila (strain ATCC BAA-1392 / DSM 18658 / VKM B-2454 / MOB10) GN=Sinac_0887 PE=4 SV=1: HAMP: HisKA: HATPase_c [Gemmata obscuriglobus UQM 2246]
MSLTTRLLLFSQAALAAVLLVFCSALYAVAHGYVHHAAVASADRSAATLVASVDIEADAVEWEPSDRDVSLGPGPLGGTVYWYVTDARGAPVDRSPAPGTAELIAASGPGTDEPFAEGWVLSRRLVHPPGAAGRLLTRDRTKEETEKGEYPALVFTAGVRTGPLHAALNALAAGLAVVSLAVWLGAWAAGRWVCRRALRPLTEMAGAARAMRAEDTGARLPPPGAKGELEELHAAMSDLLGRLRSALERERRFTAEASHQLRTPLGTILGQVEVALRRPRPPEEYERVLDVIRRQAAELTRSVDALLFLARSDADAPPPRTEPVDLRQWVPEFLASLTSRARHGDISFEPEPRAALRVAAHPPLLRELVGNLIDNALKYSPPGTPVVVRAFAEGASTVIAVEDRGPGIDAADLPHVFEPFFRSGRATALPGSGLGLAVVARLAGAFGGRVVAENRPDGGARFRVALPALADEENFIRTSRAH